jgi:hypothetical protein
MPVLFKHHDGPSTHSSAVSPSSPQQSTYHYILPVSSWALGTLLVGVLVLLLLRFVQRQSRAFLTRGRTMHTPPSLQGDKKLGLETNSPPSPAHQALMRAEASHDFDFEKNPPYADDGYTAPTNYEPLQRYYGEIEKALYNSEDGSKQDVAVTTPLSAQLPALYPFWPADFPQPTLSPADNETNSLPTSESTSIFYSPPGTATSSSLSPPTIPSTSPPAPLSGIGPPPPRRFSNPQAQGQGQSSIVGPSSSSTSTTFPPRRRSWNKSQMGIQVNEEIIVAAEGWRRHTRVYGGGICAACGDCARRLGDGSEEGMAPVVVGGGGMV